MWNCPNCHRPQPGKHVIFGPGIVRKEWRCGYCTALLSSSALAKALMGLIAGVSFAMLSGWMISDVVELSPYGFVVLVCLCPLVVCSSRVAVVEIGHTVCVHCRYDLHGNTSGACPECGKAFERE